MTDRRLLVLVLALGCSEDRRVNDGKRMPKSPPPVTATLPADLHITVEHNGVPGAPITAASLATHPPDFSDADRRAWRIASLLKLGTASTIAATGAGGMTIELAGSTDPTAPVATLFVTRRGDVIAALVDPRDPFPDYHGQGRRLGRPGDPLPRITGVTAIRITDR